MKIRHLFAPDKLPEEGDRRDRKRRREDEWRIRLNRGWLAALTILWLWLAVTVDDQVGDLKSEQEGRINATCSINERKQAKDVRSLQATYDYLIGLSSRTLKEPINQAILRAVPEAEADADIDDAPPYCDEKNFGEPEPDAKVPERPPALDDLLPPRKRTDAE